MQATGSLSLIKEPPYEVDFTRLYHKEKASKKDLQPTSKAARLVSMALNLIKQLGIAVSISFYSNLRYSSASFKHIVLNYYGTWRNFRLPGNFYLIIFKIVVWVAAVLWNFATTSLRLFLERMRGSDQSSQSKLEPYAGKELDTEHIQTHQLSIDKTGVPQNLQVDELMTMFDEINFMNSEEPGYMPPSSRTEGQVVYNVNELKTSLAEFIANVKTRKSFRGTPPAYDTARLFDFYQQIEDATCVAIHRVNEALKEFRMVNGTEVETYKEDTLQVYKNLLENRARIALNLAIAGKHCGARFMGEAMEIYSSLNPSNPMLEDSLKNYLIELLAKMRKRIAECEIQLAFNNSAHGYNDYLANLGHILAIPGTENIIEDLSVGFNRTHYLMLFFKRYTVNAIIDEVQAAVKGSQKLREHITDWLKDQVGEWSAVDKNELASILQSAQAILNAPFDRECKHNRLFRHLQQLIDQLKTDPSSKREIQTFLRYFQSEPNSENYLDEEAFLTEIFALDSVCTWCSEHLPPGYESVPLDQRSRLFKNDLKAFFTEELLGSDLLKSMIAVFENPSLSLKEEDFSLRLHQLQKVGSLARLTEIESDVLVRVVEGKSSLNDVLINRRNLERQAQFLASLNIEKMDTDGLRPELLEWILVANGILLNQVAEVN